MISTTKAEDLYFRKAQLEQRIRQLQKSARQTEKVLDISTSSTRRRFRSLTEYTKEELGKTRTELLDINKKLQALERLSSPPLLPWLAIVGIIVLLVGTILYFSPSITSSATIDAQATAEAATAVEATIPVNTIEDITDNITVKTTPITMAAVAPPAQKMPLLIEGKTEYRAAEQPRFTVKAAEQQGNQLTGNFVALTSASLITATVIDPQGIEQEAATEISEGTLQIAVKKKRNFLPGLYTLRVKTGLQDQDYIQEQDFRWGVLAINFDKAIYREGEEAFIGIAVLDDQGKMVCDALVALEIVSPDNEKITLQTADDTIKTSPECRIYGVTNLPDYYTSYPVGAAGRYKVTLTASTPHGVRTMTDEFVVGEAAFDVQRTGPTRIYPPAKYTMNLEIIANADAEYSGSIVESVPSTFTIEPSPEFAVAVERDTKYLTWDVSLAAGEIKQLSYIFLAPDLSPEFYLLGPLSISNEKEEIWKESRFWQIAADFLPTQGEVILNSTNEQRNTTQSNLTVYQQSVTTGQNIKNITNWRINGTSIMLVNMPFEGINVTTTKNAWDYSGYGYNGTRAEGITWNSTAGFDGRGAYEFDGFNDIIVLPNSFNAQPSTVLTITAWIFPKNCTNNMRIVTKSVQPAGPGQQTGAIIFDTTGGQNVGCGINFAFTNNTGVQESTPVSGRVLNPREWYFVAVTSNNTNRTTYVNGDIITSNYSNSLEIPASPSYNWTIGEVEAYSGSPMAPTTVFNGTIDELRIYNRSLSHEQIIALWKNRTDLIVSEELRPEQNWSAIVTLNNGTGDGQSVLSNPVRIVANNTPTHDKVPVLNTTDLTKNDTTTNLTLYTFTRDPDLDSLKNITNWLLNGTSIMFINMPFEKLNSSTSNVARDYSGYGYNGTDMGAAWNATEGFDGRGAYQFDGINDRLFLNNSYLAQPTIYLSFTAWIKQTDCTKAGKITAKASSSGTSDPGIIVIDTSSDGSTANGCGLRFYFINPSGSQETTGASSRLMSANTWYYVTATFNNSNMTTYVNGVLQNSTAATVSSIPTSGYNWSFGEREGAGAFGAWYYNGTIDDVRIFNRSLTQEQILALFNNKTNVIVSPELRSPQNWTADVTPNDGNGDGAVARSNQQIIRNNRAPTQTAPILNTTDLTKNDTSTNLTLYINVSDADGDSIKNITNWLLNGSSIMVLNMPFEGINNTASNNAWDYSGNGNNGSDNGGIVWNASGGFDRKGAYHFDGIDDQIIISGSSSLNINFTNISVEFWMYANAIPSAGESGVVNDAGAGNAAYGCTYNTDGRVYCYIFSGGISASTAVSAGTWHHIVETFNGTTIGLYVDGTIQAATASSQQGTGAGSVFRIGRFTNFFNGTLDDVRIWNRSLSAQQILALYNNKTNLIVSQELKRSQNWTAIVTPNDGQLDGASLQSNSVLILNTPPTQSTPILNTTDLTKNDTTTNLTLYPQSVSDADGDSIKNITNWLLNGTSIMVLNMPFEGINNTASNNAWDYSGYGNNGSDNGGIVWNASGGFDRKGAYHFDGIDDYISLSSSSSLDQNFTNLSVEFWMYANAIPTAGEVGVLKGNTIYGCTYYIDGRVWCYINNGGNAAAATVSTGTWHHIVETFNGTTIGLYVDGVLKVIKVSTVAGTEPDSSPLLIGKWGNWYFNGTLDDVRIYNRSLTAEQILALYNNKTNLIVSQELKRSQNWTAIVTPNDGNVDGAPLRSNSVLILNTPPTQSTPILNTTDLTKNDTTTNLTLYPQSVSDVDGDPVKNITNWLLNGTSIMVLNMPFEGINNTASNNAWDYSGYGNNGSDNGGIVWNATGGFDRKGAYHFDGIDDQIIISGSSSLNINFTNISVEFWMYANAIPSAGESGVLKGSNIYGCTYYIDGRVWCYINNGANAAAATVSAGTWHHIVETFNGTTIGLYVDGVLKAIKVSTVAGTGPDSTSLIIGKLGIGFFNGTFDDVRIYNRSLTPEQILALFNNRTDLIVSQELKRSQNWTAEVTPNDGNVDGALSRSNSVLILNTPPTQGTPILNTTDLTKNDTTTNLTLYPQSVSDVDGDPVKNITNWLLNGSSIMVLNMPFEGINGTASNNAWDYSGNGNNGSDNGGVIWNATGGFDGKGAYVFDGVDDYIRIADSPTLNITTPFTISLWTKALDAQLITRYVLNKFISGGGGYRIYLYTNIPGFTIFNSSSGQCDSYQGSGISLNTWTHLVGLYNGTHTQLYTDGILRNTATCDAGFIFAESKTDMFMLAYSSAIVYNGTLDDVRIYNRSLTAQQILALYNNKTNLIVSQELRAGQNWTADVTPNDGNVDGALARSNQVIVLNAAPTAPLPYAPANGSTITNRTTAFSWYNSTDADGDIFSYHLQVDDSKTFNNPEVNVSAISPNVAVNTTYELTIELDVDKTYYWRVRANDSTGFGDWSDGDSGVINGRNTTNFTLSSLLAFTTKTSAVEFGSLSISTQQDTTDNIPAPFRAENTGNIDANVSVNGSALFRKADMNTSYYQFKVRENETGSFMSSLSATSWLNMSIAAYRVAVANLTWRNIRNDFLLDINVTVPGDEPPGLRSSIITFAVVADQ